MAKRSPLDQYYFDCGYLKCYKCRQFKLDESFPKDKNHTERRGRIGYCRPCKNKTYPTSPNYAAEYYEGNKDRHQKIMTEWRANNKEKMLTYWHNYKAKLKNNGPYDKDITRPKLYQRDDGICKICDLPTSFADCSIDHIKPASKGGTHTWNNVQLAHKICNIRKGAKYDYTSS